MGIRVEYGPQLDLMLQMAAQSGAAQFNQQASAQQSQRDMQLDRIVAGAMQQDRAAEIEAEQLDQRAGLRMAEMREAMEVQLEQNERELSSAQRFQKSQLDQRMAKAEEMYSRGALNDEQYAVVQNQFKAEALRLTSLPMGGKKVTPQQAFEQELVDLPDGSKGYINPRNGKVEALPTAPAGAAGRPVQGHEDLQKRVTQYRRANPEATEEQILAQIEADDAIIAQARARQAMTPEQRQQADQEAEVARLLQLREELMRQQAEDPGVGEGGVSGAAASAPRERAKALAQVEARLAELGGGGAPGATGAPPAGEPSATGAAPPEGPPGSGGYISVKDPKTGEVTTVPVAAAGGSFTAKAARAVEAAPIKVGGQSVRPTEMPPPPLQRGQQMDAQRGEWWIKHVLGRGGRMMSAEEYAAAVPDASELDYNEYARQVTRWKDYGAQAALPQKAFNEVMAFLGELNKDSLKLLTEHGPRWAQTEAGKALVKKEREFIAPYLKQYPGYREALQQLRKLKKGAK